MFSKLKKPVVDRDQVVILGEDGTADIATVFDADDQAIYASSPAQDYAIPISDTKIKSFVGGLGRVYLIGADPDYISDTVRLASLEKSIVLNQVTQYERRKDDKQTIKIKEILLYALIAVLLLGVIFK